MSNSPLISYTQISPNRTSPRTHKIDTITIHCVVGQLSAEGISNCFVNSSSQASCNYGIGSDGRIALIVEENDRSWCSSNAANDHRAITIECASDRTHPFAINDAVYKSLVKLCADICKRNDIKELKWKADKSLIGQVDKQNMTVHRWFANKDCPGDYVYNRLGKIAEEVNALLGVNTTETKNDTADNSSVIWKYFKNKGLNDFAVAGIMGNLYAESGLKPNNLQNSYQTKLGYSDESYTKAVDSNVYLDFVNDSAGYGLAQWTYDSRKRDLLAYAKSHDKSIGDLNMQLDFLWKELQEYSSVLSVLKTASSILEASNVMLLDFERPADRSESVQKKRSEYALTYYNKYASQNGVVADKVKPVKAYPTTPFTVEVKNDKFKYYSKPSTKSEIKGYTGKGVFTITELSGEWGKLKSGAGWVHLANDYCIINSTVKKDESNSETFQVSVNIPNLNIRKGAGINYGVTGKFTGKGIFTIVEVKKGKGSSSGWGRLKSGAGWISLDYATRV